MDGYRVISRYYDLEHDDFLDDVGFIVSAVREGPVLEVGVGTGRLAGPLLDAGFEVWGLDTSESMLQIADDRLGRNPRLHLIRADVVDVQLGQMFGTVLLPLNTLWHASDIDAQINMLAAVGRLCRSGALLIIDLMNPLTMADRGAQGEVRERFTRQLDGLKVRACAATWDDAAEQTLQVSLVYDTTQSDGTVRRAATELQLRYLYRFELELLLRQTGFELLDMYGTYELDEYHADSPNLIALATRP